MLLADLLSFGQFESQSTKQRTGTTVASWRKPPKEVRSVQLGQRPRKLASLGGFNSDSRGQAGHVSFETIYIYLCI